MVNRYTSNVYHVRNMCLGGDVTKGARQKPFQGNIDYDYIMWIDSDMVFKPEDFTALINTLWVPTTFDLKYVSGFCILGTMSAKAAR